MPSSIRALVFDLDGTLVDSYAAIALSLNHARAGWALPALDDGTVRRGVGRGLEALIEEYVGPDRVTEGVARFRERYAEVFEAQTFALAGAAETLATLARDGYRIAVASNKPAHFTRPILEHLGMAGSVASVHGPDTVGSTKPDPAMIRRCLGDLETVADETIYVGDMILDVESGRRAGVAVVLVRGGSSEESALRATGRPVLATIDELPRYLRRPIHDTRQKGVHP
jgi:phosphoglycolate phosphatase